MGYTLVVSLTQEVQIIQNACITVTCIYHRPLTMWGSAYQLFEVWAAHIRGKCLAYMLPILPVGDYSELEYLLEIIPWRSQKNFS